MFEYKKKFNLYNSSTVSFSFIPGYDRSLPGFPRYAVMGSDHSGIFSLEITNATLEDDAVFECQVGPSLNNKPIRAAATLNVMCKFVCSRLQSN